MADKTKIEWCDATWNPTSGCTPISEGCQNCWAKRMSKRLAGRCGYSADDPFRVTFHPDQLTKPLHWKKPRRIAVSLMGDLLHDDVADAKIASVFAVMMRAYWHTFLVLTKRPERMAEVMPRLHLLSTRQFVNFWEYTEPVGPWPLPNIWLGTSVENQRTADERIPWLRKCPASMRFLSMEPLLGPVSRLPLNGIHCVIVGGESGPGARPMHPDWARSIRDQCQAAGVPFFFKQWGEWGPGEFGTHIPDCLGAKMDDPKYFHYFNDPPYKTWRVGKYAAGRLLDGREWNEMPSERIATQKGGE